MKVHFETEQLYGWDGGWRNTGINNVIVVSVDVGKLSETILKIIVQQTKP